ncbi:MAG: Crp/Fnr family transcriptional regulator [Bacteroides graminisolvens]|jgi:CRP-like cAMP-binding protein|uniref:Crp/Fnr family transcriptional regulator n=1 Tax=Bacteroides graminisolvens TaxID=477666 RepID=UPI0024090DE9|nr:Crp/Fnr family transcriptional regulator [Bacteroides graminisolvens]MEA4887521.1 Crp/Fnr family transcriptional regulator [Bacteroides graminisolvens]
MIEQLLPNPLFRNVSAGELRKNFEGLTYKVKNYTKGEILAHQGDVCNKLIILTKGSVRGEMIDESGRIVKIEDIASPRALAPLFLFGAANRFPVEVTANENTEVIIIPKESVIKLFARNEAFLENYMNMSANYAQTLSEKLFFMSFKTIRQKLASYFLRLSATQGSQILLDRSQQELADYFGISRPSLAREVSHMQDDGLIKADRKQITILNKEKLKILIR